MLRELRPYFEIEHRNAGRQTQLRQNYRRGHPEIDGILWALGRVSKVLSRAGRTYASDAFEQLYDVPIDPSDVSRGTSSGRLSGPSGPMGP